MKKTMMNKIAKLTAAAMAMAVALNLCAPVNAHAMGFTYDGSDCGFGQGNSDWDNYGGGGSTSSGGSSGGSGSSDSGSSAGSGSGGGSSDSGSSVAAPVYPGDSGSVPGFQKFRYELMRDQLCATVWHCGKDVSGIEIWDEEGTVALTIQSADVVKLEDGRWVINLNLYGSANDLKLCEYTIKQVKGDATYLPTLGISGYAVNGRVVLDADAQLAEKNAAAAEAAAKAAAEAEAAKAATAQ